MRMDMRQKADNIMTPNIPESLHMLTDNLSAANQSILESCPSDIVTTNEENRVTQISSGLCHLLGLDAETINNKMLVSDLPVLRELLNSSSSIEIISNDGTPYKFSHSVYKHDDIHTHVFTNISTMFDLFNENQRLREEALQLQLIDSDTSLLTHRALLLVLESQLSQCRRYETPLSVIKLGINIDPANPALKLKTIKISRLLKEKLRWSDMIARSNENHFTIILPETDQKNALSLIRKLKHNIDCWGDNCTVNFGFVEWRKNMSSSHLLDICEQSLLQSYNKQGAGQDVA